MKTNRENGKYILMLVCFAVLSAAIYVSSAGEREEEQGRVTRTGEGAADSTQSYGYTADGQVGEVTIDVESLQRSEEEARELIKSAEEEWESAFLGENESAEKVYGNLYFPSSLADGLVEISYMTSDLALVSQEGAVAAGEVEGDGETVEIEAVFSYADIEETLVRTVFVVPYPEGSAEWIAGKIREAVEKQEESTRTEESFYLPEEVEGTEVDWEAEPDMTWAYVLLLGVAATICLKARGAQNKREAEKKRKERLASEYPDMVDQMVLLISTGMTPRRAWERIIKNHENDDLLYIKEMRTTWGQLREGMSESRAYTSFGNRTGLTEYKKFGALLSQAVSKGTREINKLLEAEGREALEARRDIARKKGAEAETKLLFPMMVTLGLVLAILMVPAVNSF